MREINHLRRLKREDAGKGGLAHSFIRENAVEYPVTGGKSRFAAPLRNFPILVPSSAWLNSQPSTTSTPSSRKAAKGGERRQKTAR
jgi:hypothetical protein